MCKNLQLSDAANVFLSEDEKGIYEIVFHRGLSTVRYPIYFALDIADFINEHREEIMRMEYSQNV